MELRVTENPSERDKEELLNDYMLDNLCNIESKEIGVYLEDKSGKKIAGLIGQTNGSWLEVEYLWVRKNEKRKGVGSSLIAKAEEIAKGRGCKYSFLNTFKGEAKEFYQKNGYNEVFALEDYPVKESRSFFIKKIL